MSDENKVNIGDVPFMLSPSGEIGHVVTNLPSKAERRFFLATMTDIAVQLKIANAILMATLENKQTSTVNGIAEEMKEILEEVNEIKVSLKNVMEGDKDE